MLTANDQSKWRNERPLSLLEGLPLLAVRSDTGLSLCVSADGVRPDHHQSVATFRLGARLMDEDHECRNAGL